MRNYWKSIVFILCFLVFFSVATMLVIHKPTTDTRGFYQQRKNSIDVLYVGSSHTYCSISPIQLYKTYGFTGYIRATSCQRSWESYALLEEALRYQKPKVVVYEVMAAYHSDAQLETFSREVFDTMRPSMTKVRGMQADLETSDELDALSMYIPMFRYHERWKSLGKNDFTYPFDADLIPYKGFAMVFDEEAAPNNADFYNVDMEPATLSEKSERYIRKMKQLCDDNQIAFVMVKAPTVYEPYWNSGMSRGMEALANDMNVPFIDYNMGENAIAIDWEKDTCDGGNHLNYYGAEKTTDVFGKWLATNYDLPDHRADSAYKDWEESCEGYDIERAEVALIQANTFEEYADILNNSLSKSDDYVIAITAKSDILENMSAKELDVLCNLGDDLNYTGPGTLKPNVFIRRGEQVIAKLQRDEAIAESYAIGGHTFMASCQNEDGQEVCDIFIDGQAAGMDAIGMDFVIYDLKDECVLDTCYAKYDKHRKLKVYRK